MPASDEWPVGHASLKPRGYSRGFFSACVAKRYLLQNASETDHCRPRVAPCPGMIQQSEAVMHHRRSLVAVLPAASFFVIVFFAIGRRATFAFVTACLTSLPAYALISK